MMESRRFRSARLVLALTVLAVSVNACNGEDVDPLPAGAVSVCDNWSNDEYWKNMRKLQDLTGETSVTRAVYWANRCSLTVDDARMIELELVMFARDGGSNSRFEKHPKALPEIYETYLGATGLIAVWSNTASDVDSGDKKESSAVKELQAVLGRGLAEIMDPDRKYHVGPEFITDLTEYGDLRIQLREYAKPDSHQDDKWELNETGPTVYGWSVLAPMLRFGEFHEDFLAPVATSIINFDRQHDGDWTVNGKKATSFDPYAFDADDGMDAVLEALSRNKLAAKMVAEATGDERVEKLVSG